MKSRPLHRWLSLPVGLFLLFSALTGMTYRVGKSWFHMDARPAGYVLQAHSWDWLGEWGSFAVLGGTAIGALLLVASAAVMVWQVRKKIGTVSRRGRGIHRFVGAILLLPLAATAVTGLLHHIMEAAGAPDDVLQILMRVHTGAWMGRSVSPWYVAALGVAVVWMFSTGLGLRFPKRRSG